MIKALKIINTLKKAGLIKDYAIGGGYALNYHLEPILTFDLDIFILIDTEKDYSALYEHFRSRRYKIENVYIVIGDLPVQFLPSYISPLIEEAIKKAKRIRIRGIYAKILRVEYLIATLLLAFRPKDRLVIPQLLEQADMKLLNNIMKRFSDEKTPLDKRLRRILENLQ
jgi:DNA-binding Lrp family transcriptional regulator